jgi:hypothetical protein
LADTDLVVQDDLLTAEEQQSHCPQRLGALNASFMCYHKQASRFCREVLVMHHCVIFTEWYRRYRPPVGDRIRDAILGFNVL